jgi:hypothetical protein
MVNPATVVTSMDLFWTSIIAAAAVTALGVLALYLVAK